MDSWDEKEKDKLLGQTNIDGDEDHKSDSDDDDEGEKFPPVSYFKLFRFSSSSDKILLIVGISAAFVGGILSPLVNNIFGKFVQAMLDGDNMQQDVSDSCVNNSDRETDLCRIEKESTDDGYIGRLQNITVTMTFVALAQLFTGYLFCVCLKHVSENQVYQTKKMYFKSLLGQSIGWYDTQQTGHSISRISQNGLKIQRATGEGLGLCICLLSSSTFALLNALYHGWLLTLISLLSMPLLAVTTRWAMNIQTKLSEIQEKAYAKAGIVAEEALGNIRTVVSYGGETKELIRYEENLKETRDLGKKRGAASGLNNGLTWLIFYSSSALTLWLGTRFFLQEQNQNGWAWATGYNPESILIIYLSIVMASYEFGEGMSYFETFTEGRIAAAALHSVIDRESEINVFSETGNKPQERLKGNIVFKDVEFYYPSRPECEVLQGLNLKISSGQTVALVGSSGCGKSTCLQLLQRFYDAAKGSISVDGHEIESLNVEWLRSQMGVVGQEPVLFNGSISENIRYGREDVTQEEIENACKQANAHSFISKLPEKYKTVLGDRGALISGGQKQRIAIARALVRNPTILLLDEATSALDSESEAKVQAALDKARIGRTTLIVAHRLSTIKDADLIVVIKDGQVLEKGAHTELMSKKGAYFELFSSQNEPSHLKTDSIEDEENVNIPVRKTSTTIEKSSSSHINKQNIDEDDEENESEDDTPEDELANEAPLFQIFKLNLPEWPLILLGTLMSLIQGCIQIVHGILFGGVIAAWALTDLEESQTTSNYYGLMFIALAVIAGGSAWVQNLMFSLSGEQLTFRLRKKAFKAMIYQDIEWFDKPSNHLGAVCTRLAEDAAMVQGVTGVRIGNVIQGSATVIVSIGLALFYSFKLGSMGILFVIILNVLSYYEEEMSDDDIEEEAECAEESSKVVIESVNHIRTVASLGMERRLLNRFSTKLLQAKSANLRNVHFRGFVLGLSQSFAWFAYVVLAYYGSYLMKTDKNLTQANIIAIGQFITFGTVVVAEALANAPDYYKAKVAGARIMKLLQLRPKIQRNCGISPVKTDGKIVFDNVDFSYPTRTSHAVLQKLSFTVQSGQKVAIVGPSGCGKSTCIQLIQRFYDPENGAVVFDGTNIANMNVDGLRSLIGIVSQEPVLFDRTIQENIAYGENSKNIPFDEVINAAKKANIHEFIMSLPEGYNTRVGQLGSQLSGGQKQRVAIARALIRNPKIILLDEATSALDAESEKIVQNALELAMEGRTSVTISHRLNLIKCSDLILVIGEDGHLVQKGSHSQLMADKTGLYFQLASKQHVN